MKWFMDQKIAAKLLTGFILVAIIAATVGVIGIVNIKALNNSDRELYENITVPISELADMAVEFQRIRVNVRDILLTSDPEVKKSNIDQITQRQALMAKDLESVKKVIASLSASSSTKLSVLYDDLVKKNTVGQQGVDKVCALATQEDQETEIITLMSATGAVGITTAALGTAIDDMIKAQIEEAKIKSDSNTKQADSSAEIMIIVILAGVFIALGLGVFLSSIIGKPIKLLTEVANKIAVGDVDVDISARRKTKDELGTLMGSFEKMVNTLKGLLREMDNMAKQQAAGDIDVFVSEEKFDGAYRVMAKGTNDMIRTLITQILSILGCIGEFGKGSFDVEMEKFPGKKVIANDCVEALRKNLKDVSFEVHKLILASQDGKLSERGNSQAFQGDWAELIKGLNELLDAITEPIQEASAVLEEIAKGNLNISVQGVYKGDHAIIKNALNDTITSLNEVLGEMNNASGQVASGARQVSDSAQALSQGSTEQASSIEQLTSSMQEISAQTQLNAANALKANELALAAKEGAIKGNEQMQGMLKAMDDINEASGNISKIIKVIDEIAFQTNILALNAAVEAARAGQHGKGFAVVAEEVRNLAARSANAAKETTALIEGSIKQVEGGTKIASNTAAALIQIVEGVTKTTKLVGEIATASNEQASGINQVNQGILQVSDVVQTNSATSEESAAASEELSSQAELLKEQVNRFKLKNSLGSSHKGFDSLNPEVVRMLENMAQKNKLSYGSLNQGHAEAAVTSSKPKISLSDREFGKY
jgi:methyl-accepting chemotaxis protein